MWRETFGDQFSVPLHAIAGRSERGGLVVVNVFPTNRDHLERGLVPWRASATDPHRPTRNETIIGLRTRKRLPAPGLTGVRTSHSVSDRLTGLAATREGEAKVPLNQAVQADEALFATCSIMLGAEIP